MIKILGGYPILLQKDYGAKNDCTLTAITAMLMYRYTGIQSDPLDTYKIVEEVAKKYFYSGEKFGTIPVFINSIINDCIKKLGKKGKSAQKYIKGTYSFSTIKKSIDKDKPVILSVMKCGKYEMHTITIVGYDDKTKNLWVMDNWKKSLQNINYKDISLISSINYLK